MKNEDIVRTARRRANAKFGFLIHLMVFVAVNAVLFFINQRATPEIRWFAFPLGGWTLGLAIHGLVVFLGGTGLREKMIDNELKKLQARCAPGAH